MRFPGTFLTAAFTTLALTALAPRLARAQEQLVLFDINYTHTQANDSHYTVRAPILKQPSNWTAPINYTAGNIHFYQEVETKPSLRNTIIDFCFMSTGYGCVETLPYKTTGINETVRSMAAGMHWYQRNQINFTRPLNSIQMILKDPETYTNGCNPKSDCLPSKMRFVATLVPPGATYQRPTPTPGFNAGDAGVAPAADAATASPDGGAAPGVDAAAAPADSGTSTTPVTADASAPKPMTKMDAAPKGPVTTDPPEEEPDPAPAARKGGGCAVGGGDASNGLAPVLLLAAIVASRRIRRRH